MYSIFITLLLFSIATQSIDARFIDRGIERRSDRVVSVYDRNCFFSPMGCHFLQGRRAMTFITPSELEEEQRFHRSLRMKETK
ncbi:hypothetical protein PRIPAC_80735 [Pristionchus pacificus]|uniref:Uncharacterized protein n=1 Tax=Pristionchus pacificus TaxID=54126 RepID=A0A454Y6F8_PRIPA|nr:hypothetical protein PRIPAC_80735 [Pristionchus pacificus]|eukprot:PDM64213.1 hypothetical protein PRIPAC_54457 [Pristionchus pacificus]